MKRCAAIDIGTNTVLLLVAETDGNRVRPLLERQKIPRLGRNVDSSRNLATDSMERVIRVLEQYRELISENYGDIPVMVTATSAVRDATNKDGFIREVAERTGFSIRILRGRDEAEWTFDGALAPLVLPADEPVLVVDIGGGSTELAEGYPGSLLTSISIDMGSVRFTERYLPDDPPETDGISRLRRETGNLLSRAGIKRQVNGTLVGVAGTVTTLAALVLEHKVLNPAELNNRRIGLEELSELIQRLGRLTSSGILQLNESVLRGREDVILAGLLILEGVMKHYDYGELLVSAGGIRHGAVLRAFN